MRGQGTEEGITRHEDNEGERNERDREVRLLVLLVLVWEEVVGMEVGMEEGEQVEKVGGREMQGRWNLIDFLFLDLLTPPLAWSFVQKCMFRSMTGSQVVSGWVGLGCIRMGSQGSISMTVSWMDWVLSYDKGNDEVVGVEN